MRHIQYLAHSKHLITSNIETSQFHHHDCSGSGILYMKAEEIWAALEQTVLPRGKPEASWGPMYRPHGKGSLRHQAHRSECPQAPGDERLRDRVQLKDLMGNCNIYPEQGSQAFYPRTHHSAWHMLAQVYNRICWMKKGINKWKKRVLFLLLAGLITVQQGYHLSLMLISCCG